MSKTPKPDSEAALELETIKLFESLGWQSINGFHETYGAGGTLGRETRAETVLLRRLVPVLERLNPDLPPEALEVAVEELRRDRSALSPASANREVMGLLRDGVPVQFKVAGQDEEGESDGEATVRVVDWTEAARNDFLLVSQLWIGGEMYSRRADLVGFVNGVSLVFIELKEAVRSTRENGGKLGVFWHTQGSGKSLSMIFFAQKALRKLRGDWTFLVLTGRDDLDSQIYKNFASNGVVTETAS